MSIYTFLFVLTTAMLMFTADSVYGQSCPALKKLPWSYQGKNGPKNWGKKYPDCKGKEQSPLLILSYNNVPYLGELNVTNYDQPISKGNIENNGYTIKVTPGDGIERKLFANGTEYSLRQFHFHWGNASNRGSEHYRFVTQYAMEMQLVHVSEDDQTAIIGVFFKEEEDGDNEELQNLVDAFPDVEYKGDETDLTSNINLGNLFKTNTTDYVTYQGSLTTPPCTQGVTWFVVLDPSPVGTAQMNKFRQLYAVKKKDAQDGCRLVNNFRPFQKQNDRFIFSPPFKFG